MAINCGGVILTEALESDNEASVGMLLTDDNDRRELRIEVTDALRQRVVETAFANGWVCAHS